MNQKRNWPQDYSSEEIRNIMAQGDVSRSSGFNGWREAGLAEILIRTKNSAEKSNKKIFGFLSLFLLFQFSDY